MGSMLGRAGRQVPDGSPLQSDLHEIREIAQTTLDNVRGLSQTLHPSILEDVGLEGTIDWYLSTVERQAGVAVSYEQSGVSRAVESTVGIHVYRVLQEALNNVARHSGADRAWVRLRFEDENLVLEVEDHGKGIAARDDRSRVASRDDRGTDVASGFSRTSRGPIGERTRSGLGMVGMRERAAIVNGTIEFLRPHEGGTLVRLTVPIS
jgi:signal transduction histidine kinase